MTQNLNEKRKFWMNRYYWRYLTVRIKKEKDKQANNYILKYKYREKDSKVLMKDKMPQYSKCETLKIIL